MSQLDIHIDNKTYAGIGKAAAHIAIKDCQLSIANNEFVCLTGPSGCGKTTLMNIIAGLDKDYQGSLLSNGKPLNPQRIGYVFQEPRLLPWRTIEQNIQLVTTENKANLIDELLRIMQLEQARHLYPQQVSLGMARRAALARAFVIEPDLLLMDEPFVSLDDSNAKRIRSNLIELRLQRPHTILFVTHDLREAITLADRILFLGTAPTSVIKEVIVPLSRSERNNENAVDRFREILIDNH